MAHAGTAPDHAPYSPGVSLALALARQEALVRHMPALTNDCAWLGVCRVAELSRNPALHRLNGLSASALASIEAEALELLQLFAAEEIEPRAMRLAVQSYLPAARRDAPEAATMPDPEPMRDLQLRLTDARARARAHREATVTLPLLANSLLSDPTPAMARELLRAVPEPHEASVRTSRSDSGAERALESLGRNLVEAARGGHMGPLATRPALIDALIQALQPDGPRCALLIGEQGVGRTGLVHGLAARIATGRVPAHLQKAHLLEVPGTALRPVGAGADSRVRVLEKLMLDAQRRDETDRGTILFVDDIDGLTRSSASSPARLRLADVIRSALSGPPVMWIAAVDSMVLDDEPDLLRELDGLCTMLHVEEPSPAEAERMVSEACEALEARHRLTITPAAISAAVALSARFIGDRRLPDKAIDLLDDICGACGLDSIVMPGERTTVSRSALRIERPHVVTAVADRIGVPRDLVAADDAARCRFLQADLSQRLIEQAPSIAVLSSLLERALPEQPDHRPLAAMLLASDDADAVQAVATSLARVTFGDGTRAVRIVPEQFREHGLTTQLLGTRSGPPGELTLTLRRTPGMVVLIDGTEQCGDDDLQTLRGLLTDAPHLDPRGREIVRRQSLFIVGARTRDPLQLDRLHAALGGLLHARVVLQPPGREQLESHAARLLSRAQHRLAFAGRAVTLPAQLAGDAADRVLAGKSVCMRNLELAVDALVLAHVEQAAGVGKRPAAPETRTLATALTTGAPRLPVINAMLRSSRGSIFQLRAGPTVTIGRGDSADWVVFLVPRTVENDEATRAISRLHLVVRPGLHGVLIEPASPQAVTTLAGGPLATDGAMVMSGMEINLGGVLQMRLRLFHDSPVYRSTVRMPAPQDMPDDEPATDGDVATNAVALFDPAGAARSLLMSRLANRSSEQCIVMVGRFLIGAGDHEIVVEGTAPVAAEVVPAGPALLQVRALAAGVTINDQPLELDAPLRDLAHQDCLGFAGTDETLTFLQRPAQG